MAETQTGETTLPEATKEYGPGGVPKGAKTTDYYRTFNVPERFDNPGGCSIAGNPIFSCLTKIETPQPQLPRPDEWFQGYNTTPQNPLYRTTNASYGSRNPTVHTMPTSFHAKSQQFSQHLGTCGMYRNFSMNTALDQSKV